MNRFTAAALFRTSLRTRRLSDRARKSKLKLESLEPRVVPANPIFAVGTDAGMAGQVKVFDAQTQALKFTLNPFANSFKGGVRVAVADVSGDGQADVIAATGPGGGNKVRVYDGATGGPFSGTLGNFTAFTSVESNGVWVAAGDVDMDGKADIVVGSDGSGTPRVRVFSGANGSLIGNLDLSGIDAPNGIRVAAGDFTGDGKADVVLSAGPGGPPRVVVVDGATGKRVRDFFAFEPESRVGVHLAVGDMTGDGVADLICGQGSGGGWVKVFDGADSSSFSNLEAFPLTTGGVRVGAVDADGDGRLDVVAAQGPGDAQVKILAAAKGVEATLNPFAVMVPFGAFTGGAFAAGDARPASGGGGASINVSLPHSLAA